MSMAKRVGRITDPTGYKETTHGHQRVFCPGGHLETPLILSAVLVHASTVQE